MARNGIQYADVHRAIDELIARGDTPSVQRIREILGTGSFTTISEHFRQWRDEREHNRDVPPAGEVPESVVTLATELWHQARHAANEGLAHYREEADGHVKAAQADKQQATLEAENAAQRESALAEHLRHREAHIEGLSTRLAESGSQQEHLQQRCDSAEASRRAEAQKRAELETQLQQQAQTHEQALEDRQAGFEQQLAEEQQRNETTESKLLALLDSVRQERINDDKTHARRHRQLETRLEEATTAKADAEQELRRHEEARNYWQQRCEQAEAEAQRHRDAAAREKQNAGQLREKLERAEGLLASERDRRARDDGWQTELDQRLDALHRKIATLPASTLNDDDKQSPAPSGSSSDD